MRTPKEWANDYMVSPVLKLKDVIEMAQKEAYNEALDDAAENASIASGQHPDSKFDPRPVFTYEVDKESILKLKK